MENDFRFLIYKSEEEEVSVNAVVKDESVWLTQKGMAELFAVEVPAISKHLPADISCALGLNYFHFGNNHFFS